MGVRVYGLRRPGLAPYHVARRPGRLAGAVFHYSSAILPDQLGGGFGYGLLQDSGLDVLHRSAVHIGDLVHHMGLIVVAAVDQGAEPRDHLDHGHIEVLAEAVGGQVRRPHIVRHIDQAGGPGLPRQVDIGLQADVEDLLELAELVLPQGLGDLHHGHVAGVGHRLFQGQPPFRAVVALDVVVADFHDAVALQIQVRCYHAVLQGGCHRKGLGGGARLVGACDAIILPQVVQVHVQLLLAQAIHHLLGDDGVRLPDLRVPGRIGHLLQQPSAQKAVRVPHIVQVIGGIAGHGQDFPCIHVHHDAARVLRAVSRCKGVLLLIVELL